MKALFYHGKYKVENGSLAEGHFKATSKMKIWLPFEGEMVRIRGAQELKLFTKPSFLHKCKIDNIPVYRFFGIKMKNFSI
jgi:hypothetical protein